MPDRPKPAKQYGTFPDHVFQRLADKGDTQAKQALEDRKRVHRLVTEPGDPTEGMCLCTLGDGLLLLFRRQGRHVMMSLAIDKHTTLEQIRVHWSEIRHWRERLLT